MPYQEAPDPPVSPELREACRTAIHVVTTDGRVLRGGDAATFLLGALGYTVISWIFRPPPMSWLMRLGYLILSRNRRFFARFMFRRE